ncbi:hypothetical protein BDQ17DRAFT_1387401 [Cyathus striatus]|nr:hypothetical protein BDQ17DRAFT_1387401 [Cyathus striatus]
MPKGPFRRLSVALRLKSAYVPYSTLDTSSLAQFLSSSKSKYLKDRYRFAWIQSEVHKKPTIPLMQFERDDFSLREENLYALRLAGVNNPREELLCLTDLTEFKPFPSHNFALVDHNRLAGLFSTDNPSARVTAVVDHHEDEQLYKDAADPRIITPAGSCTSLVASLFPPEIPPELATLLLCSIFIDTDGLKPGGKGLKVDHESAESLVHRSTLAPSVPNSFTGNQKATSITLFDAQAVKDLTTELNDKKSDLSHLSAWDLLRRDYKEYSYALSWAPNEPTIKAGLATVPTGKGGYGMDENRGLTALGILTSFRDGSKPGKSGRGKHKREMAWIVLDDAELPQRAGMPSLDTTELAKRLWKGLEDDEVIKVKKHKKLSQLQNGDELPPKSNARVYKQGNADANRKIVAPLLKNILQGSPPLQAN